MSKIDYYLRQSEILGKEVDVISSMYTSSQTAIKALVKEICLSPKPGLVDMCNSGAHKDMDISTFILSIKAISIWFDYFYLIGNSAELENAEELLKIIRPIGIECEQSMYNATNNINTHKGGIFAFGVLLAVIGRLDKLNRILNVETICKEVANVCNGLVSRELKYENKARSVGEKLYNEYRLTGARGEAESGYLTVRDISLPIYLEMLNEGYDEEKCMLQALLYLLAYNKDTNLVSRGGLSALEFVQKSAKNIINKGGVRYKYYEKSLREFDHLMIKNNLSPGGTADLLSVTWFLSQYS